MQYQVYDLHQCSRGERVQVTLSGSAANVRLMDSSNYNNYKHGRRHSFYGGLMRRSRPWGIKRNGKIICSQATFTPARI